MSSSSPSDRPGRHIDRRTALALGAAGLACASGAGFLFHAERKNVQPEDALRVLGNPHNEATYRALGAARARTSNAAVEVSFSPRDNDDTLRELLLGAFTGAQLPDVAFINGNMVRVLAERGLARSIDDVTWDETSYRVSRVDGKVYGIPFGRSLPVVVFNTRLLEASGIDPSSLPSDWAGITGLAQRIDRTLSHVTGGFIEHDGNGALSFLYLLGTYGLTPLSPDERHLAFINARGVEALKVLQDFGRAGQAREDMSRRQARRAFQAGRIGVFVTMTSVLRSLSSGAEPQPIVVKPLPIEHAAARIPAAGPVGVMLARSPGQVANALDFLRFAASAGQSILTRTSGYLPANPEQAQTGFPILSHYVAPERVTDWYAFPGPNALKVSKYIQDALQQVATLQLTPETAAADIAKHMRSQLSLSE